MFSGPGNKRRGNSDSSFDDLLKDFFAYKLNSEEDDEDEGVKNNDDDVEYEEDDDYFNYDDDEDVED